MRRLAVAMKISRRNESRPAKKASIAAMNKRATGTEASKRKKAPRNSMAITAHRSPVPRALPSRARSARPQPSERARRQERVEQPVHRGLDRRQPGAAVPDRHLPERESVADERGDTGEAEDVQVLGAGGQRAPRDVRGEDSDNNGVEEPLHQLPPHRHGAAGPHGEHHDGALL